MDVIKFCLEKPVSVLVGVILIVLFGTVAFLKLPYQLTPKVDTPVVSVSTVWPGATPYEIERDIVEEQERFLKGLQGLDEMTSLSSNGMGQVTLRFKVGTQLEDALLRTSNKLDEVSSYPENVDRPVMTASENEGSPAVILVLRPLPGNTTDIYTYRTYFQDECLQFLERVPGVAEVEMWGGVEKQMQVLIKPDRLAAYGLTIGQVVNALRGDNVNVSAGNLDVGRREYRVRTVSEFRSEEDISNVVVFSDGQRRVYLHDLADVSFGYEKNTVPGLQNGEPGVTIGVQVEPDANVLEVTKLMASAVADLNTNVLAAEGLTLEWLTDQRTYIANAIKLVRDNIFQGSILAVIVLLCFLRSFASTLVITTAIPISIIGSFIFMQMLGRTLNVISLAGISFAVGMLVDDAIVVLENIDRHRKMGKSPYNAAYDGTLEVWGAVLTSTLTTVAVFLPVVFLEQEAGMLFRDIAVAVTTSVMISLFVSVTVVPIFTKLLFENRFVHWFEHRVSNHRIGDAVNAAFSGAFMGVVKLTMRNWATRIVTIVALVAAGVFATMAYLPKMEYLPEGNRDLIYNMIIPPPGLSFDERLKIGHQVSDFFEPYFGDGHDGYPGIQRVFFVGRPQAFMVGVMSKDQLRTRELIPLCRQMISRIPGVFGVSNQAGIFGRGMGRGRTIDVNLNGREINDMVRVAGQMMDEIHKTMPEAQVRPEPSLELLYPEARFVPDGDALRSVGMSAQEFGVAVDVLMDGRRIGDFKQEGHRKIDLVVKVADADIASPQELAAALLPTPKGRPVPVSSLSHMEETSGLTEIRHLESNRTISLQITPPYSVTLQEAMETINNQIVPAMEKAGHLEDTTVTMSGTADRLQETRAALQWNFLLAMLITYLLMSALYSNFIYPIVIMLTVPLAGAGGVIGLKLVNMFIGPQQLDVLTMLGFILLIGIVVKNPILIVHQSLINIRVGAMKHREAVLEATRSRLRPIYMTAASSIFGMLPLVIWPGAGSELYRGLGSVVLGGLALSTFFTVFLTPALLMFVIWMEKVPSEVAAGEDVSIVSQPDKLVPAK